MASGEGWHADPTARYSHRWWDGQAWTSRVFREGVVLEDHLPADAAASDQKLFCGRCHLKDTAGDFTSRCKRCGLPLRRGYFASVAARKVSSAQVRAEAQSALDAALGEADAALADADFHRTLLFLDQAIVHGTVLRTVTAGDARRTDLLAIGALVELHIQAIRMFAKCVASFTPDAFERELLRRFAAAYEPEGGDGLPGEVPDLIAWCASRVAWAETEIPTLNALVADYCVSFDWESIRHAIDQPRAGDADPDSLTALFEEQRGLDAAASVLGVLPTATATEIKKAYHREAAKFHPDVLGDIPEHLRELAEEKMKKINAAYELLSSCGPSTRAAH